MNLPPIHEQAEFRDDALRQMFGTVGWGFFKVHLLEERTAMVEALLTADPRDVAAVADLQSRVKALQHVLDFEALVRATSLEGMAT